MRGVDVAMFMLCIAISFTILGGMGWFVWGGVQPEDGGFGERGEAVGEEVAGHEPGIPDSEGTFGDFGLVTGALDGLTMLRDLTVMSYWFLGSLGVPEPMAAGYALVVNTTIVLGIAFFIRGLRDR